MQNNRIHKLSPLLINQIAAGEVVTRPASVVKELIENAIDAHATHIRIDIEQGGLGLIQISDNGNGIHPDDMILAVTRHATSKLADVGALVGIDSLGFRGEALASIAAVSHLTLTSSHNDSGIGQQLTISGSDVSQATIRPIVKNKGTCVSVRDLYFNVPGRRSHLKSIATEFSHIEQVVQRLAISFADVEFQLYHQDKLRLGLNSFKPNQSNHTRSENYLNRLEQALNLSLQPIAVPIYLSLQGLQNPSDNQSPASVTGWLFVDDDKILPKLIYINRRLVSDLAISQALQKVARQHGMGIDDDLQLGYTLFFELPSEWINVNIHPSKQQVKIQPLTNILAWLSQSVYEKLQVNMTSVKSQGLEKESSVTDDVKDTEKHTNTNINYATKDAQTSFGVAESQLDYNNLRIDTDFNNQKKIETPQVLSVVNDKQQQYALIFWQARFYLMDLAQINSQGQNKRQIQQYFQNNPNMQVFANAFHVNETDMVKWLLSQQTKNQL